jgi:hypothetical protein
MVKIARNSAEFRYEFSEGFTDQRPVLVTEVGRFSLNRTASGIVKFARNSTEFRYEYVVTTQS